MKSILPYTVVFFIILSACTQNNEKEEQVESKNERQYTLVDTNCTAETRKLYNNLMKLSKTKTMYGHQDDLAYGMGWWAEEGRSDVKELTGSYPAVFGWDLGEIGNPHNLDTVDFGNMKKWIEDGYNMGSVITISWHTINPVTKTDSWDTTQAVKHILPGGKAHDFFNSKLNLTGNFIKSLKGENGEPVPVIFRPWHEHSGHWFWWGRGNCTEQEYIDLWKYTVHYLRDTMDIHNLIYAFSPAAGQADYFYGYPGDQYVDVLGLDSYFYGKETEKWADDLAEKLNALVKISKEKNKLCALTETGHETLWKTDWHTDVILKALKQGDNNQISYFLTWRNRHNGHFYAPYKGHASAEDFLKFKNDSLIIFNDELPELYK